MEQLWLVILRWKNQQNSNFYPDYFEDEALFYSFLTSPEILYHAFLVKYYCSFFYCISFTVGFF